MTCNECREQLSEFEAGELSGDAARAVEAHVATCRDCAGLLQALTETARMTEGLREEWPVRSMSVRILKAADELFGPDLADAPEIMTPEDVARFLRVSAEGLESAMASLPAFDIGGRLRYRKARIIEWIEEQEQMRERGMFYAQLRAV